MVNLEPLDTSSEHTVKTLLTHIDDMNVEHNMLNDTIDDLREKLFQTHDLKEKYIYLGKVEKAKNQKLNDTLINLDNENEELLGHVNAVQKSTSQMKQDLEICKISTHKKIAALNNTKKNLQNSNKQKKVRIAELETVIAQIQREAIPQETNRIISLASFRASTLQTLIRWASSATIAYFIMSNLA